MANVRHTFRARRDLIDIWLDIAAVNPAAADGVYDRLEAHWDIGEVCRGWSSQTGTSIRRQSSGRTALPDPLRGVPDGVQIVRVLHGARHVDITLFKAGLD